MAAEAPPPQNKAKVVKPTKSHSKVSQKSLVSKRHSTKIGMSSQQDIAADSLKPKAKRVDSAQKQIASSDEAVIRLERRTKRKSDTLGAHTNLPPTATQGEQLISSAATKEQSPAATEKQL